MKITIDEFKQRYNLLTHVMRSGLPHEKRGSRNFFKCIAHDPDDTPSMMVDERRWHCFSCGKGGDAIDYLSYETGKTIAEILNGDVASNIRKAPVVVERKRKEYKLPDPILPGNLHRELVSSKKSAYFNNRGITDDSIARFMLGYGYVPSRNFPYPRYTIPIFDENNTLVTIRYREDPYLGIDTKAKYVTHPGTQNYLFNLNNATKGEHAIYVGSQLDAILLAQLGIPSVGSASEGCFKKDWELKFSRFREVTILRDHDKTGYETSMSIRGIMRAAGINANIVSWPTTFDKGFDVTKAYLELGEDWLTMFLANNIPWTIYYAKSLARMG